LTPRQKCKKPYWNFWFNTKYPPIFWRKRRKPCLARPTQYVFPVPLQLGMGDKGGIPPLEIPHPLKNTFYYHSQRCALLAPRAFILYIIIQKTDPVNISIIYSLYYFKNNLEWLSWSYQPTFVSTKLPKSHSLGHNGVRPYSWVSEALDFTQMVMDIQKQFNINFFIIPNNFCFNNMAKKSFPGTHQGLALLLSVRGSGLHPDGHGHPETTWNNYFHHTQQLLFQQGCQRSHLGPALLQGVRGSGPRPDGHGLFPPIFSKSVDQELSFDTLTLSLVSKLTEFNLFFFFFLLTQIII